MNSPDAARKPTTALHAGWKLSVAAVLSVALIVLLLPGYFGRFCVSVLRAFPVAGGVRAWQIEPMLADGRIVLLFARFEGTRPATMPMHDLTFVHRLRILPGGFRASLGRWLGGFAIERSSATTQPAINIWQLYCPIWCVLLPSGVVPVIWFLRRRRPEPRGFAIDSEP